jgi:acyl carrier protein
MTEQLNMILYRILKLGPKDLHDDLTMDDVELWDSLRHMEIITAIESDFDLEFSYEEITSMRSIGAIRTALAQKVTI